MLDIYMKCHAIAAGDIHVASDIRNAFKATSYLLCIGEVMSSSMDHCSHDYC